MHQKTEFSSFLLKMANFSEFILKQSLNWGWEEELHQNIRRVFPSTRKVPRHRTWKALDTRWPNTCAEEKKKSCVPYSSEATPQYLNNKVC